MNLRIQWKSLTVKALQARLQQAYKRGDVRLVRRISVLLELGQTEVSIPAVAPSSGVSVRIVFINDSTPFWCSAWTACPITHLRGVPAS